MHVAKAGDSIFLQTQLVLIQLLAYAAQLLQILRETDTRRRRTAWPHVLLLLLLLLIDAAVDDDGPWSSNFVK